MLLRRELNFINFLIATALASGYNMMLFYRTKKYPVFCTFDNSIVNSLIIQLEPLISGCNLKPVVTAKVICYLKLIAELQIFRQKRIFNTVTI